MNLKLKVNQSEEYYRKILLLDKLKPFLSILNKQYIFFENYCWDILLKDSMAPSLCFWYSFHRLKKPFPEGEKYISEDAMLSYHYSKFILKDRFLLAEEKIFKTTTSDWKNKYLAFLESIGKRHEVNI